MPHSLAPLHTFYTWAYLDKRRAQTEYAHFQAAGYPIGSGSVESGNQVVVEARLKGAGMHWAREPVNPMAALRNGLCGERWDADGPQITQRLRTDPVQQHQQRQRTRWAQRHRTTVAPVPTEAPKPQLAQVATVKQKAAAPGKTKRPDRPAANPPWRHSPIGRARLKPYRSGDDPKLSRTPRGESAKTCACRICLPPI